ncbi:MAG: hypothetical protein NC936_00905 [Candidatus Omnitrophica bacterium]|nr:hypothetical protein [Candidatus Omnitrophota bacterium]
MFWKYWMDVTIMSWSFLFISLALAYLVCLQALKEKNFVRMLGIAISTIIIGSVALLALGKIIFTRILISQKQLMRQIRERRIYQPYPKWQIQPPVPSKPSLRPK